MPFYQGLAKAHRAWVYYHEGDLVRAEDLARQAQKAILFNNHNIYLWVLIAISLKRDELEQVNQMAQELIDPGQIRLPDHIEAALRSAVELYEGGIRQQSKECFERAVQIAQDTGYF